MTAVINDLPPDVHRSPVLRNLIDHNALTSECLSTLVRFVAHQGGTDLSCTAQRSGYVVSMRCDGVIHKLGDVPKTWAERLVGNAKVEARLDASEHRRPQDGRLIVLDGFDPIDVRVSTIPTFFGEDLALRILDRRSQLFELENLGLCARPRDMVRSLIHQPNGLILVSGATGSGKTTTLYALLNELNDGTRKINTLEDPVEFDLTGVHQSQINLRIGLDFADLLPALLRQDPDVIMVGEIRDPATARTAVRAAATGHLVLATLHASNAAAAVHSMRGLGTNPHLLGTSLRGVIAQQLLRRICDGCGQSLTGTGVLHTFDDVRHLIDGEDLPVLHQGRGCMACNHTGYRRRLGVYEILHCSPKIREMIEHDASPDAIRKQGIEEGMIPLKQSAKVAVARGQTTLEEAMRVMDLLD